MNKNFKKQILNNPVSEFSKLCPNSSTQQISILNALALNYRALKLQLTDLENQKRVISRRIGEAKRTGNSFDTFMITMQELSSNANATLDQLYKIECQILDFFQPNNSIKNNEPAAIPQEKGPACSRAQEYSGDVTIELLGSLDEEWNTYVKNNPAASIYHRAEWKDLIKTTFGHEGIYFCARDNNRNIIGILPLIRIKSRMFGDYVVSMPYFNYGGAIADHSSVELKLMRYANDYVAKIDCSHIEYRDNIPRPGFPVKTDKVNMILPLPSTPEDLWRGLTPKLRAQIKRPQRENPRVFDGGSEYLDDFYKVFARNMRDLGTPVYAKSFFRNILSYFPEQSRIIVVQLNKKPVAAAFLLGRGTTLEIPWASTIRNVNHLSMNMLLYWEVLRYAINSQYRNFDFGRSSKDSGTFRFKGQWGAMPKPSYWHYWLRDGGDLPSLNPNNPKYALMINIWKRLPIIITNLIGPLVVKNLP